ncbi:unnamed protein product [Soboliphyme baturini]|uniref:Pept_C1 domain-containing protein n=1 Tax=Soboliphyme baturini TaxID=241478 RepID=A0A183J8U8_9BILA|nr:unnamed protein product [Soboliphyme baturini]
MAVRSRLPFHRFAVSELSVKTEGRGASEGTFDSHRRTGNVSLAERHNSCADFGIPHDCFQNGMLLWYEVSSDAIGYAFNEGFHLSYIIR